jgi:CheY-like chemotaxis protein
MVLIAVTGWGQEEDRRRALEAGFDHHLTKPIAAETLESLLQSLDRSQPDRKEYLASGKAGTRAGVPEPH